MHLLNESEILTKIYFIRNRRVMIDKDLAELYGVETKVLNQAVKRQAKRFPEDFMFRLTETENSFLRSQFVTLENKNGQGAHSKYLPNVFTEQGVAMLSSVLNSDLAIDVNIQIIRVFTKFREIVANNTEILLKLERIQNELLKNSEKINKHDADIEIIFKYLKQLLSSSNNERKAIGYKDHNISK